MKSIHTKKYWQKMDSARERISKNETARSKTVQDLKGFNSESISTQAKKGEHLVAVIPRIKKAPDLLGDNVNELSTKNKTKQRQKMALTMKNGRNKQKLNSRGKK